MDISKLYEGQKIKNYVELCSLIGKQPTTGNGRKAVLKELSRHCDYTLSGRVFTINRIFKMPKEKIRSDAKWIESISLSILYKLAQQPRDPNKRVTEVFIENYKLALYVGLCDMYFYTARALHNNQEYDKKLHTFPVQEDFYRRATLKFSSVLDSVKKSLDDRKLVYFEKTWKYDVIGGEKDVEADMVMKTFIIEASKTALEKSPYSKMQHLVKSVYFPEYKRTFSTILRETHGIINVKEYTKFGFTDKIDDNIKDLFKEIDQQEEVVKTNNLIVSFLEGRKIEFIKERTALGYYSTSLRDFETNRTITPQEQKEAHMEIYQELIDACIKLYDETDTEFNFNSEDN